VDVGFLRDWMVFGLDFYGFSKGYVGFLVFNRIRILLVVSGIGSFVNTKINTPIETKSPTRRMRA
jgi:hypothetical protein